jgi:hypothetical protein
MIDRRHVINSGLFTGLAAFLPGQQSRSSSSSSSDDDAVAKAITGLNDTIQRGLDPSPELARIREQQRIFLKSNQKFPDFVENYVGIGMDVVR